MTRSRRLLGIAFLTALIVVPVRPAAADDNPCKGTAPGPHCRPPCFYTVVVNPGDPASGEAPSVTVEEPFC